MSLKLDTITPETITQLQTLIQADPALIAQLQSCTDAASSAAVIAKAAAAKGIDVSQPSLVAHFEAATAKQGALSDAELEQFAGGGIGMAVILSIAIPFTCAGISIVTAISKGHCGEGLLATGPF